MKESFRISAERAAAMVGSHWAFVIASITVAAWAFTGPYFRYSDTWQLFINTGTTIVTFLMVFLIQNTQNRETRIVGLKLDELLRGVEGARTGFVNLDSMSDDELAHVQQQFSRLNPRDEWQTAEAPHLRIVDAETWERVQALKSSKSHSPKHEHRRPKRILSGLLRCGCCGGGMSNHGRDRHGKLRVRCTTQAESGCCKNAKSFPLERIEETVFDGMRDYLRDPRLIEVYFRRYNAEREKALSDTVARRTKIEARLARLTARRERMIDLLVDGLIDKAEVRARVAAIKEEQFGLEEELMAAGEPAQPVALHPATIERYLETVDRLAAALAGHAASANRGSVVADFRALVQSVTVHGRGHYQGFEIEVKGRRLNRRQCLSGKVWGIDGSGGRT